jgi:hypothetical protein
MSKEQFEREKQYQTAIAVAKSMLRNAVITADEYLAIDTILRDKYRPIIGSLFTGKSGIKP